MRPYDTCPHCGAENRDDIPAFKCGSYDYAPTKESVVTDLCRERQAHNRTRLNLETIKGEAVREIMLRDRIEKRCEIAERELTKQTSEVARLRELLNQAEHSASLWELEAKRYSQNADYWKERTEKAEARLAPAPEEDIWEKHGLSEPTEPVPEWRELGPDEVIQEGDEFQPKHHDRINGEWMKVWEMEIGLPASKRYWDRYRTRRPLPVQDKGPCDCYSSVGYICEKHKGYCDPAPVCPYCKNNTMVWEEKDFYNHWLCHRAGCGRPIPKKAK